MKKLTKENWLELSFFAFILLVWLAWAWILPFNEGPDEYMRSRIVDYIVEYGKLPTGYQQEIMDYSWGFTYGFRPILPQMVEAVFVRVAMIWTKDAFSLIFAGRLVSVVCGMIFAGFVRAISKNHAANHAHQTARKDQRQGVLRPDQMCISDSCTSSRFS